MPVEVRVHIATALSVEHLARIRAVSPRLRVTYHPYIVQEQPVGMEALLPDVEVLLTYHAGFDLAAAPHLRWVQLAGDGVDYLQGRPILASDVTLTNARVFAAPIAEYAIAMMVMLGRLLPKALREFQTERRWPRDHWSEYAGTELSGRTLAILGYGSIGRHLGRVAQALDMRVIATRRSLDAPTVENGVEVLPSNGLYDVLAQADYVVVCLPLTPETEGLIGEAALRRMKPTAYLVAAGRGRAIDELALVRCLREGWIAGAALDVFAQRPLPPDSPLFDVPNVILTPHMSGISASYPERMTALFCDNLGRYLAGQPLLGLVDKQKGY
ncbi:MAG: D-2-hydroxyacid dehydrogenase [Chloroflexi bacterium]|nr:D-2-hydroxyacid dehydrogenase [Chloroflexota bacterium]